MKKWPKFPLIFPISNIYQTYYAHLANLSHSKNPGSSAYNSYLFPLTLVITLDRVLAAAQADVSLRENDGPTTVPSPPASLQVLVAEQTSQTPALASSVVDREDQSEQFKIPTPPDNIKSKSFSSSSNSNSGSSSSSSIIQFAQKLCESSSSSGTTSARSNASQPGRSNVCLPDRLNANEPDRSNASQPGRSNASDPDRSIASQADGPNISEPGRSNASQTDLSNAIEPSRLIVSKPGRSNACQPARLNVGQPERSNVSKHGRSKASQSDQLIISGPVRSTVGQARGPDPSEFKYANCSSDIIEKPMGNRESVEPNSRHVDKPSATTSRRRSARLNTGNSLSDSDANQPVGSVLSRRCQSGDSVFRRPCQSDESDLYEPCQPDAGQQQGEKRMSARTLKKPVESNNMLGKESFLANLGTFKNIIIIRSYQH